MERSVKVPLTMYQSFLVLQNPRKYAIFDRLCNTEGKLATKDIEQSLERDGSAETIGFIADALKDLEDVRLAKYMGDDRPTNPGTVTRQSQTFKCYEATEHGRYIYSLCKSYDSDRPLASLGGAIDPKRVVASFAKVPKDELAITLNRFRDVYLLGAVLVSIYYQKRESASSEVLSTCLDGRLSREEVESFMGEYAGIDGLVTVQTPDWNIIQRGLMRLAEKIRGPKGRNRMRKWLYSATYSLTPEGKKIALGLADQFYPSDLGVNEEHLRPEKIEADDGVLGRAIVERVVLFGAFLGLTVYIWWDLFHSAPSDSLRIGVDAIGVLITVLGWILYMPSRISNLAARILYWRRLRREEESKPL